MHISTTNSSVRESLHVDDGFTFSLSSVGDGEYKYANNASCGVEGK